MSPIVDLVGAAFLAAAAGGGGFAAQRMTQGARMPAPSWRGVPEVQAEDPAPLMPAPRPVRPARRAPVGQGEGVRQPAQAEPAAAPAPAPRRTGRGRKRTVLYLVRLGVSLAAALVVCKIAQVKLNAAVLAWDRQLHWHISADDVLAGVAVIAVVLAWTATRPLTRRRA